MKVYSAQFHASQNPLKHICFMQNRLAVLPCRQHVMIPRKHWRSPTCTTILRTPHKEHVSVPHAFPFRKSQRHCLRVGLTIVALENWFHHRRRGKCHPCRSFITLKEKGPRHIHHIETQENLLRDTHTSDKRIRVERREVRDFRLNFENKKHFMQARSLIASFGIGISHESVLEEQRSQ